MSTNAFAANPFRPHNPFLVDEPTAVEASAQSGEVCYALVASGPPVAAEEVESHLDAVEIKVSWGAQVLKLAHVGTGRGFVLGEGGDFALPEEALAGQMPIVESRGMTMVAIVPSTASGWLAFGNGATQAVAGGQEIVLAPGNKLTIDLSPVTIEIATVRAGKKAPVSFLSALASGAAAFIGLSFLGHAAVVASMAMFMPTMGADDAEAISRDQILAMQKLLTAAAEREIEPPKETPSTEDGASGGNKGGEPHMGESGAAGTQKPVGSPGHMAFKGSDDHSQLSRKDELAMAAEFGLAGMLRGGADLNKLSSPWADDAKGADAVDAKGAMFGDSIGDAFGFGVGLWGTGEGGGGKGAGVGINGIGSTVGGGNGKCGAGPCGFGPGDKGGWGVGSSPGKGGHTAKALSMRTPSIETNGRLPPEVIQRIVRQNFGRFRLCYENALRTNPSLSGRVVTKFAIGRDGAVSMAQDAGSDLPDQGVTQCIVRSFTNLSFPAPEGGVATVTYPMILSPGES